MRALPVAGVDLRGVVATVGHAAASMLLLRAPLAPHGFAPQTDRTGRQQLGMAMPPLPSLWTDEAGCTGGDGSKGTPARPATGPQTWVVTEDYPIAALLAWRQGRTGFRLSLDSRGTVQHCTVTASSGTRTLDTAACFALSRRARFEPARDDKGCPIPSSYSSAVVWQIPPDATPSPN